MLFRSAHRDPPGAPFRFDYPVLAKATPHSLMQPSLLIFFPRVLICIAVFSSVTHQAGAAEGDNVEDL